MCSEAPADGNGYAFRVGDNHLRRVPPLDSLGRTGTQVSGFADGVLFGVMLAFLFVGLVLIGCEGIG